MLASHSRCKALLAFQLPQESVERAATMHGMNEIAAPGAKPAGRALWRAELTETVRLAWPIALTQLSHVAMMTTDLALVGRLGGDAIAAAALAQIVLFATFVLGMGLVSAVSPLAAQAFGAREPRMVRRALRVGLWAATLLGIPLSIGQLWGEEILLALGQEPKAAALASAYLQGLAWSLIPAWWFIAIRGFMGAVNRPEPALWITLAAIPLNFALAYVLIFGTFGFPRLEMLGAGIATTIVNIAMCAAALWFCYRRPPFKKYHVLGRFWRFDSELMKKLVVIGMPISAMFLLEYGLFGAAGIVMGWIGANALAAHQIALQVASIMFMIPFGISMAATVRVGQEVGRRNAEGARRAGFVALGLGAVFMAAMTVMAALGRGVIPLFFIDADAAGAAEIVALASFLLVIGATFFIADGVQTVAAGALRGLNDTRIPLLFSALSFWVVGFSSVYVLAFPLKLGINGVWIGFTIGLLLYATLLVWRFHALTARGYMPEAPHAEAGFKRARPLPAE
jgi:MATE family multidrug resistance protein